MKLFIIKMSEVKQNKEKSIEIKSIEKYKEGEEKMSKFDTYMKTSDILSDMQQLLISHIGLSMGIVSTIIFISSSKTFISSHLKYIIITLMLYSFMLFVTGYGEYIEKFIKLNEYNKFKDVTKWDYVLSIIYFVVGIIMLVVMILLYISLVKDKLV
jgi:hypothetical protein